MLTSLSSPLFAGRKRQLAQLDGPPAQRVRQEEAGDINIVDPGGMVISDQFEASGIDGADPAPHLRASLPEVGDTFQSRSKGNLRDQAQLMSGAELKRDLEQHTAFKTYHSLDLLLDLAHPLPADGKSKNPAYDRFIALRELSAKANNPDSRLSASSKRYLESVGLIDAKNHLHPVTRYDVGNILKISPKSQNISLLAPNRDEAKTYWTRVTR